MTPGRTPVETRVAAVSSVGIGAPSSRAPVRSPTGETVHACPTSAAMASRCTPGAFSNGTMRTTRSASGSPSIDGHAWSAVASPDARAGFSTSPGCDRAAVETAEAARQAGRTRTEHLRRRRCRRAAQGRTACPTARPRTAAWCRARPRGSDPRRARVHPRRTTASMSAPAMPITPVARTSKVAPWSVISSTAAPGALSSRRLATAIDQPSQAPETGTPRCTALGRPPSWTVERRPGSTTRSTSARARVRSGRGRRPREGPDRTRRASQRTASVRPMRCQPPGVDAG